MHTTSRKKRGPLSELDRAGR
uniref:Uncharacterized protein n=1 Tax=Ralstonia syzygii R24 TaxID=907261 RepID=G3A708_9RALS|nr:hypothetical protein RALSY_40483 [Ralstonia syzygii R24]